MSLASRVAFERLRERIGVSVGVVPPLAIEDE